MRYDSTDPGWNEEYGEGNDWENEDACDESYTDYREDFHTDDAIGVVNYGEDGPFDD